eukprot:Awhi_evm1s2692
MNPHSDPKRIDVLKQKYSDPIYVISEKKKRMQTTLPYNRTFDSTTSMTKSQSLCDFKNGDSNSEKPTGVGQTTIRSLSIRRSQSEDSFHKIAMDDVVTPSSNVNLGNDKLVRSYYNLNTKGKSKYSKLYDDIVYKAAFLQKRPSSITTTTTMTAENQKILFKNNRDFEERNNPSTFDLKPKPHIWAGQQPQKLSFGIIQNKERAHSTPKVNSNPMTIPLKAKKRVSI